MPYHFVLTALVLIAACDPTGDRPKDGGGTDSGGHPAKDAGLDAGPDAACTAPASAGACQAYFPRYHHDPLTGRCERFVYGGCGGNANNYETLVACEGACDVTPRSEPCRIEATDASLPGARVRIEAARCRLAVNQSHVFRYTVELDQPITYTAPDSGGGCGRCGGYTTDPLLLADHAIEGGGHRYCECDVGCCPPTTSAEHTLKTGSFDRDFEWFGVEWGGPSDTDAPFGPPFPPGTYAVRVVFEVPGVGTITAALPITLFDPADASGSKASCEVGGQVYASGEGGIDDPFSCNTCACVDGVLACTEIGCPDPCPDGTTSATSCSQCGPTDACEVVRHACLPVCSTTQDCADAGLSFCAGGVCKNVCG